MHIYAKDGAEVLLADDNHINLTVALGFLSKHNIQADTAEDGVEAVEMIKTKRYDLVFMNHLMPKMDGLEAARCIRAMYGDYFRNLPIIALAANPVENAKQLYLDSGMNDFICKPIDASRLNVILAKWMPKNLIKIVDASVPAAPTFTDETGKIIDTNKGRANFQNDGVLYTHMLADFAKDHGRDMELLHQYMYAGQGSDATRIAHTLKSTAHLIGAAKLSALAAQAEASLRESGICGTSELDVELRTVIGEIDALVLVSAENVVQKNPVAKDPKAARQLIDRLKPLLRVGNVDSYELLDDAARLLPPFVKDCDELISAIDSLNFSKAFDIINNVKIP